MGQVLNEDVRSPSENSQFNFFDKYLLNSHCMLGSMLSLQHFTTSAATDYCLLDTCDISDIVQSLSQLDLVQSPQCCDEADIMAFFFPPCPMITQPGNGDTFFAAHMELTPFPDPPQ